MASAVPPKPEKEEDVLSDLELDFMADLADYKETPVLRKIVEEKEQMLNNAKEKLEEAKEEAARYLEINKGKNNRGIRVGLKRRTTRIEELMEKYESKEKDLEKAQKELEDRLKEEKERKDDDGDSIGSFMYKYLGLRLG
jgi:predicted transposase YdaD